MSAEPRRFSNSDGWARWEGHVVNGIFPLLRFLGGSGQGAVFLSEYNAGKTVDVAIKLVPAIGSQAEMQLAQWRTAAALSHPNLIRLFDMGRCQLGGRDFLFVVMEQGEQSLAQVLTDRALEPAEARALLLPTLDALAFLHRNQLVHGRLKSSNILAVGDQLKLTSDAIRPPGQSGPAADIWSLGVMLLEAFTQRAPVFPEDQDEANALLANVPAQFANTVRRCLNPTASSRPTAIELQVEYKAARPEGMTSDDGREAHPLLLAMPVALLVLLAVAVGLQPSGNSQTDSQSPAEVAPEPAPPEPKPKPKAEKPKPKAEKPARTADSAQPIESSVESPRPVRTVSNISTSRTLMLEVTPDVPQDLLEKIQGRILVTVRVLVDESGNVMAAMVEKAGPNKSLASLADQAAREWKFAPSEDQANRVWILTFAFTREGVTARATSV
jgi:TonB family protein